MIAVFSLCRLSSTCNLRTVFTLRLSTMASVQSMFIGLSQRGRLFLGQIRQNAEANTEIGPPLTESALYSDEAGSINQSERALYRNFIIISSK